MFFDFETKTSKQALTCKKSMHTNILFERYLTPNLEELRSLLNGLEQTLPIPLLQGAFDGLAKKIMAGSFFEPKAITVIYGTPNPEEQRAISEYLNIVGEEGAAAEYTTDRIATPPCQYQHFPDGFSIDLHVISVSKPSFAVFFVTQNAMQAALYQTLDHMAVCATHIPVLSVVAAFDQDEHYDTLKPIRQVYSRIEPWENMMARGNLKDELVQVFDPKAAEPLQAMFGCTELEQMGKNIQKILQDQEFALNVKLQEAMQDEISKRGRLLSSSFSGDLKHTLQHRIDLFEKRNNEIHETVFAPSNGDHINLLSDAIEKMPILETETRAKNIVFKVDEPYRQAYTDYFKELLQGFSRRTRDNADDFTAALDEYSKNYLNEHKISLTLTAPQMPDNEAIGSLVHHAVRFERDFEATAMKKKPMEMMSGARMYFMMFMMLATMLGIGSDIRKQTMYFTPFTILLVGLGVWMYFDTQRKENQENHEKHLQAAKEQFLSESKRILQDFERKWQRQIIGPLRDWAKTIERESQSAFDLAEHKSQSTRTQEYNRAKAILDSLRKQEAQLKDLMRAKQSLDRSLLKQRAECIKSFKTRH
jgi:hypothetical protein